MLVNVLATFFGSLAVRTIVLEVSLLVFFLSLFAKRSNRKETEKSDHRNDVKIYL